MLWLALLIAIVIAAGVALWCGLAVGEAAYGYPIWRAFPRSVADRRAERRFLPADVSELDATFHRVVDSNTVSD